MITNAQRVRVTDIATIRLICNSRHCWIKMPIVDSWGSCLDVVSVPIPGTLPAEFITSLCGVLADNPYDLALVVKEYDHIAVEFEIVEGNYIEPEPLDE